MQLVTIISVLVTGGALYGGIRSDLRHMHEKINHTQATAERAHKRLDDHVTQRRTAH